MRNMTSDNQTDQTMTLTTPKPLLMSIDDEIARLNAMIADLQTFTKDFDKILAERDDLKVLVADLRNQRISENMQAGKLREDRDRFHAALQEIARWTSDGTAAGITAKALNT